MSGKKNKAGRRKSAQAAISPAALPLATGPLMLTRILALLGLGVSAYLSVVHYQAEAEDLVTSHFCQAGSVIDCTSVLNSSYATLFDLPVALWAIGAYIITLVLTFTPQALALLFVCSWLFVFGLYMAAVSFFALQSVCLFCTALYLINIGLFVSAIILVRSSADFELSRFAFGLLGCVIVTAGIGLWQNQQAHLTPLDFRAPSAERMDRSFVQFYNEQREVAVQNQERYVKGAQDASLRITEFVDFRCPSCAVAHDYLTYLRAANKGEVRVVFHHYPLDQACNPIAQQVHPSSCAAAIASECAGDQDAFWAYADRLFANQKRFSRAELVDHAEALDLDRERFESCLGDTRMADRVRRDVEEGQRLGISATPTLIINGRVIEGLPPPKKLATLVTLQQQQNR